MSDLLKVFSNLNIWESQSSNTDITLQLARDFCQIKLTYPQKTSWPQMFSKFQRILTTLAIGQQSPPHIVIVGNGSCRVGCQLSCSVYHSTCVVLMLFYSYLSLISTVERS